MNDNDVDEVGPFSSRLGRGLRAELPDEHGQEAPRCG